jgi:predicted nucleotidyltransferase
MSPTDEQIRGLATEIGTRFDSERVVLFGSRVRGEARPDSDVDLLVVMDYAGSSVDQTVQVLRTLEQPFPVDVVVRSPKEIERRVRLGDFFLRGILREGQVLYERPHERMAGQGGRRLPQRAA